MTATQLAHRVLGSPEYPAPKGEKPLDLACAVCGGEAEAAGSPWHRSLLPDSFAPFWEHAIPDSDAVCQACAYTAFGATFKAQVAARGLRTKIWPQVSWRSYSHAFSARDGWTILDRPRLRAFLVDPPPPPFVVAWGLTGQKNILFRAEAATDRDLFTVQVEEERVWVSPERFATVLAAFEGALAAGLPRDEVLTGRWSANGLGRSKVDAARITAIDRDLAAIRARDPGMLLLAWCCARRPD